jgi:hypothetical protein
MKAACLLTAAVVAVACVVACGPKELVSSARDRDITVDGNADDWQGMLKFLEDANLSYGLANDAESMYIVLVVGDRETRRQIIMSGLYLWFDPDGGKGRHFGIRYPIGLQEDRDDMTPVMREHDPNKLAESFDGLVKEMMIVGPHDETWRRAAVGTIDGVETAAAGDPNKLVLEFKVPVANDGQYGYGIGALPGAVIGMGVQTPKIDHESLRERMRPAGGGAGMGGGPGGMGGGMGGMGGERPPRGDRPGIPDPIEVWTKVRLAPASSNS